MSKIQQSRLDFSCCVPSKPISLPPRKADVLGTDITKATNRLNFPFFAIIFTQPCRYQRHYHPFNLDILWSSFYPRCKKIKSNILVCFQYRHKNTPQSLLVIDPTPLSPHVEMTINVAYKNYVSYEWFVVLMSLAVCFTGCIIEK